MHKLEVEGDLSISEAVADYVVDDRDEPREPAQLEQLAEPREPFRRGFFDPERPSEEPVVLLQRLTEPGAASPADPSEPPRRAKHLLKRLRALLLEERSETFKLERPIGYWHPDQGAIIVPRNLAHFRTDLTSVPRFFTWLIPKTGSHLPAALVHDGLVHPRNEPPTYIAAETIDRTEADELFRIGMGQLGTSWLRRWLIWSAVAIATAVSGPASKTWKWWLVLLGTGGVIIAGGVLATVDLFDCREPLPWMADRPWWLEILTGAAVAVIVSVVLASVWPGRRRAGLMFGLSLSLLLHVTAAVLAATAVFTTIEAAAQQKWARAFVWSAVTAAGVAPVLIIGIWAC